MRLKSFVLVAILSACSSESQPEWVKPESDSLGCEAYQSFVVAQGVLNNNVWNRQAAKGLPYSQCIESRELDGRIQYGWSWSWPNTQRAVFAQPQIKIGQSPWQPEQIFGHKLPAKLKDIKRLTLNAELDVITNGEHNVATTLWFVDSEANDKDSIRLELMIWTYYTPKQFEPAGRKLGEFRYKDVVWEYWWQADWSDKSGVNDNEWRHIGFRQTRPNLIAHVDVMVLIDYAIKQGHIDPEWLIADLEFGTEVMAGQGIAWLKEFNVEIQKVVTTSSELD